jgi:hypothetical protein
MQIALTNQIFLLDILDFFHQCDSQTVQQRLADRLFDDDNITILCKFHIRIQSNSIQLFRLWF